MGDAAGELADGFQFLRLPQLFLQRLAVGDVDEGDEDAIPGALGAGAKLEVEPKLVC